MLQSTPYVGKRQGYCTLLPRLRFYFHSHPKISQWEDGCMKYADATKHSNAEFKEFVENKLKLKQKEAESDIEFIKRLKNTSQ